MHLELQMLARKMRNNSSPDNAQVTQIVHRHAVDSTLASAQVLSLRRLGTADVASAMRHPITVLPSLS